MPREPEPVCVRIRALGLSLALLAGSVALPAQASLDSARVPCPAPRGVRLASPFGLDEPCSGVRPGAWLKNPDASNCTAGFMFSSSPRHGHGNGDGSVYLSTAAHCIKFDPLDKSPWELTWAPFAGPVEYAYDDNTEAYPIGTWRYAVHTGTKDFALIQLYPGIEYDGAMCHFGGPTAMDDGARISGPVQLHYFGQGYGISAFAPSRTAVALNVPAGDSAYAVGVATFGDSGAAVMTDDGRAIGLIADLGPSTDLTNPGTFSFSRLSTHIQRAQQKLGIGQLRLITG